MNSFFTKVVRKRGGESNPGGTAYKGGSHLHIPKKGGGCLWRGELGLFLKRGELFEKGGLLKKGGGEWDLLMYCGY